MVYANHVKLVSFMSSIPPVSGVNFHLVKYIGLGIKE